MGGATDAAGGATNRGGVMDAGSDTDVSRGATSSSGRCRE